MTVKLIEIFENVFHVNAQSMTDNISSDTIKQWNSLNHLKLILAIEQEFNVQFDTEIIPELNSLKKIYEALRTLGKNEI
jgi:acyl carrier protein